VSASINHHREGEGPPLVLLHGIGLHWQIWKPIIGLLATDFDVIACDSPGFGRSAPLTAGIEPTIPAYVDAFEWFFAELGLERPHVAGNSMGGAIALELARRRAVSSATALSPAGFWTTAERRFCQLSLAPLAAIPPAVRPLVQALARTRAGRVALFSQTFGYPTRLPGEEAVATLHDAWAAPAFRDALEAFATTASSDPRSCASRP
jgi:pimeloyl-ACP methyl ester carboxylesterase